jgi:hypothetical protein
MTSSCAGPADQVETPTAIFRRFLVVRIVRLVTAAFAMAAVMLAFVFRESSFGFIAALTVGAVTADVVAVEACRHETLGGYRSDRPFVEHARGRERRVVSLTQRPLADPAAVIAGLPADTRPFPSIAAYDQLLRLPDRAALEAAPTNKKGTGS